MVGKTNQFLFASGSSPTGAAAAVAVSISMDTMATAAGRAGSAGPGGGRFALDLLFIGWLCASSRRWVVPLLEAAQEGSDKGTGAAAATVMGLACPVGYCVTGPAGPVGSCVTGPAGLAGYSTASGPGGAIGVECP